MYKSVLLSGLLLMSGAMFPLTSAFALDPVGSLPGAVQVDAAGQANWSMSVQVAPGVAGIAPRIDVSVSTSGKLALSTGSSISRCAHPFTVNNVYRPVQLSVDDDFCLNGSPLIEVAPNEYRTELESFKRIVAFGSSNNGPNSFQIQTGNGTTITLGGTEESKSKAANDVIVTWHVSNVEDVYGNGMWYEYEDVAAGPEVERLLTQIQYGSKTQAEANTQVEFNYELKPDSRAGFDRGVKTLSSRRLASIESSVTSNTAVRQRVRLYNFSYEQTEIGGFSRVERVEECVVECFRPTLFKYAPLVDGWESHTINPSNIPQESLQRNDGKPRGTLIDLNGDGLSDWVISVKDGGSTVLRTWLKNTDAGYTESNDYALEEILYDYDMHVDGANLAQLVDVNGDGLVDLISAYSDDGTVHNRLRVNNGTGFDSPLTNKLPDNTFTIDANGDIQARTRVLDVNGDALPDFVQSFRDGHGVPQTKTWLNATSNVGVSWVDTPAYALKWPLVNYENDVEGTIEGDLLDINADGLVDTVVSFTNDVGVSNNQTWLNTGSGWLHNANFDMPVGLNDMSLHPKGAPLGQLLDVNGDGLLDVLSSLDITDGVQTTEYRNAWINTGQGFIGAPEYSTLKPLWHKDTSLDKLDVFGTIADVDSDGRPELVRSFENASSQITKEVWSHSSGSWQSAPSLVTKLLPIPYFKQFANLDSASVPIVTDLDIDGAVDLLVSTPGTKELWLGPVASEGTFAGYLTEVVNGLGSATRVEYGLSNDSDLVSFNSTANITSAYPNIVDRSPIILVRSLSMMDGLKHPDIAKTNTDTSNPESGWYQVRHRYGARKVNLLGRGWLGFSERTLSDNRTGIEVLNFYRQDYPFAGKSFHTRSELNGTIVNESFLRYEEKSLNNGSNSWIHTPFSLAKQYDSNGQFISAKLVESRYDDFGSLDFHREGVTDQNLDIANVGASTSLPYETISVTQHDNNEADWILGMARNTSTEFKAVGQPTLSNYSTAQYNDQGQLFEQTLEPGNPKAVKTTYYYDSFGNLELKELSAQGKTRSEEVTYTPDGKFPATKTNSLDHTGSVFFDARWGKAKRKVDVNGIVTNTIFDSFGSVLREETERPNAPAAKESAVAYWCEGDFKARCDDKDVPEAVYFVAAFDDQGQSPQTVYFDAHGRELLKWTMGAKLDEEEDAQDIYIRSIYDSQGRKIKESQPGFDLNALKFSTVRYNSYGQIYEKEAPDFTKTSFSQDGLVQTITDAKGNVKQITQGLQGKATKVIDGFGTADASLIEYTYDAKGSLRFTKADNRSDTVIELQYDPKFGHKVYMNDPDMGVWTYEYNAFGELFRQTDAKLQVTETEYDDGGRITERHETDVNQVTQTTSWVYDTAPLGTSGQLARGLLHSVSAPHSQYTRSHEYDLLGRPVKEVTSIRGDSFVSERAYYRGTDRVVWEKYPSDLVVTKDYDSTGYPTKLKSVDLPSYQTYLNQVYQYQDIVAHAEQLKTEKEALIDEHRAAFEALEDDVEPYIDDINELIADANYWQDLVSRTAEPLQEHQQWAQDYNDEYLPYAQNYNERIQKAIDEQNLAQPFITQMEAYQDQAEAENDLADGFFFQATANLHAACSYLGADSNHLYTDLVDMCIHGPPVEGGGRISEMALGSNSSYICVREHPSEPYIEGDRGTCLEGYDVYSWQGTGTNSSGISFYLDEYNDRVLQYGVHVDEHNRLANLAQIEYDQAMVHSNNATYWENQANNYVNGMNIYGAITTSHTNVMFGFKERYDDYLESLQQYAGVWECVAEDDVVTADIPDGEIIDDDVWGKIVLNHQAGELHRIEDEPKQESCDDGFLWVRTTDGSIQAKQIEFANAKVGLQRDYHQYQYGVYIEPYNELIEAANAFYDGSLEADSEQYALLLSVLGVETLSTTGVEVLEEALDANGTTYWEATAYNADGQIKHAIFGNGIENTWEYDDRGRSTFIKAQKGNAVLQSLGLDYDNLGNLEYRNDYAHDISEAFGYDALNRLTSSTLSGNGAALYHQAGLATQTFTYDEIGNIDSKSDVGDYVYGQNGAGPHALTQTSLNGNVTTYQYDANGNQTSGNGRSITYTQYNKPNLITKGGNQNEFDYGPERQLIWQRATIGASGTKETIYAGTNFEREHVLASSQTLDVHHLKMGGHTIAVLKTTPNLASTFSTHFLHQDHLDSVVMITDEVGGVVERNHYDAFGKLRTGVLDQTQQTRLLAGLVPQGVFSAFTDRGYTNHRQLNGIGLVHMGGRVYDPHTGRFLSADPNIQAPLNTQSYNRYSYVLNNPLSLNDPTGYLFSWIKKLFKYISKAIKYIVRKVAEVIERVIEVVSAALADVVEWAARNIKEIIMVAVSFVPGGTLIVAAYQAAYTLKHGGSLGDILKAMAVSAILQYGGEFVGALRSFGEAVGRVGQAIGSAIGSAVKFIGASAQRIITAAITNGVVQSIYTGITSKILGGSFSQAFKNSIGVNIVVAGIIEFRNPTPETVLNADEEVMEQVGREAYKDAGDHTKEITSKNGEEWRLASDAEAHLIGISKGSVFAYKDGLQGVVYTNGLGDYIVGLAGTNGFNDIFHDIKQALGFRSSQYDKAQSFGGASLKSGMNVSFTGHSLGGGLAMAAAYSSGGYAFVVNSAGLHSRYRNDKSSPTIRAIYSHHDILSLAQDLLIFLPSVSGTRTGIPLAGWHPADSVCRRLNTCAQ